MPSRPANMWDTKLIKAYYLHKHYQVHGFPIWMEESPDVMFIAKKRVIRSLEATQKAEHAFVEASQNSKQFGVTFYAHPVVKEGKSRPTRSAWIEEQIRKQELSQGDSLVAAEAKRVEDRRAELLRRSEERATMRLAGQNDGKMVEDSI